MWLSDVCPHNVCSTHTYTVLSGDLLRRSCLLVSYKSVLPSKLARGHNLKQHVKTSTSYFFCGLMPKMIRSSLGINTLWFQSLSHSLSWTCCDSNRWRILGVIQVFISSQLNNFLIKWLYWPHMIKVSVSPWCRFPRAGKHNAPSQPNVYNQHIP